MAESRELMERPLQLPPPGGGRPFVVATAQEGGGHELPFYKYVKLINILGSDAAQAAFRDYGEDDGKGNGYVPYIEHTLGDDEELQRFVRQGAARRPPAPPPAEDRHEEAPAVPVVTPPRQRPVSEEHHIGAIGSPPELWGDEEEERAAEEHEGTPSEHDEEATDTGGQPLVSPPIPGAAEEEPDAAATPLRLPPEAVERLALLNTAADRYAEITALRRSSPDGGIFSPGNSRAARWLTAINFMGRNRGRGLQAQSDEARTAYRRALDEYTDAIPGDNARKVQARLDVMGLFEDKVHERWLMLTRSRQENNQRVQSRMDRWRARLAGLWLDNDNRWSHGAMAAALPALGGIALGFAMGNIDPAWIPAATGIAWTGIGVAQGNFLARTVSKYRITNAAHVNRLAIEAQLRNEDYGQRMLTGGTLPNYVDVTEVYDGTTQNQERVSARRLGLAQLVGGAAAAITFYGSTLASRLLFPLVGGALQHPGNPNQPTPSPGQTPTPTPGGTPAPTPVPGGSPVPGLSLNSYPWTNANIISHQNPWNIIQQTMGLYDGQFGAHLQLVHHPNGTVWIENLVNGHVRALDATQQAAFNQLMINHFGTGTTP